MPTSPLKPSLPFASCSAVLIAVCLLAVSSLLAETLFEDDPFALVGLVVIGVPAAILAMQQYRGTFRLVPSAAWGAAVMLFMLGAFLLFGAIANFGEAMYEGIVLRLVAPILLTLFGISIAAFLMGWANIRWSKKLRAESDSGGFVPVHSYTLQEMLLGVTVIAATAGAMMYFARASLPEYAEHVDASKVPFSLPDGAYDVSYAKGFRGAKAYEFSIDEAGFRKWFAEGIGSVEAQSAGIPLQEINGWTGIQRYHLYHPSPSNNQDQAVAKSGLYYRWSKEDRVVQALFDRDKGRAYFQASYH